MFHTSKSIIQEKIDTLSALIIDDKMDKLEVLECLKNLSQEIDEVTKPHYLAMSTLLKSEGIAIFDASGKKMSVVAVNKLFIAHGIIATQERTSTVTESGVREFKYLTKEYIREGFGDNASTTEGSGLSAWPIYNKYKIQELLKLVGLHVRKI